MPAVAEARVSVERHGGMVLVEGHSLNGVLLQEAGQDRLSPWPERAVSTMPVSS